MEGRHCLQLEVRGWGHGQQLTYFSLKHPNFSTVDKNRGWQTITVDWIPSSIPWAKKDVDVLKWLKISKEYSSEHRKIIWNSVSTNKNFIGTQPCSSVYILCMAAFMLQKQSGRVVTETTCGTFDCFSLLFNTINLSNGNLTVFQVTHILS